MTRQRSTWPAKRTRRRHRRRRNESVGDQVEAFADARRALARAIALANTQTV